MFQKQKSISEIEKSNSFILESVDPEVITD